MKIFRYLLPYLLCAVILACSLLAVYLFSDNLFAGEGKFDPQISNINFENRHTVYPWYEFEYGDAVEISDQGDVLIQLINALGKEIKYTSAEFKYSPSLHMYYAKNIRISSEEALDIAYYRDASAFHIAYIGMVSPKSASQSELEEALEAYRNMYNDGLNVDEANTPTQSRSNPFYKVIDFMYETQEFDYYEFNAFKGEDFETIYECIQSPYRKARFYIYDGLVWFTSDVNGRSVTIAIDPSMDDSFVVLSFK